MVEQKSEPTHRSGAVARMLRMPVATLRVWERRYGLTQPMLSPSGQRLYSAEDVQRLALLKRLTDLGHAIGSLAPLSKAQLQGVAATHESVSAAQHLGNGAEASPAAARTWRVAVIGAALAKRLQQPAFLRRLAQPVQLLGPFEDVSPAATALHGKACDLLLVHQPRLQSGWLAMLEATTPALAAVPRAVLYRFAAEPDCAALAAAGAALLCEPQSDTVLVQWLQGLRQNAFGTRLTAPHRTHADSPLPAPRRWEDAALAEFASLSSTIACECPRHVAELLMQLAHFEAYSADCAHRSVADAELHGYLLRVAASSREQFETALARVAMHEGLLLPA